jgi:hypothetical protein
MKGQNKRWATVHGLIREQGSFGANPGMKDLARHLYTRMNVGRVVVVADSPQSLLPALRKQWLKLARKVQLERAGTLNVIRVNELAGIVAQMQNLRFTTHWPDYEPADVYIVTVDELLRWAPDCRTMYVACDVSEEKLHLITALMPQGSLVVIMEMKR